ncbi:MAG: hypothetical protein EPN82_03235 [Bacteroidetes bacterium]|nr:MAG: hypothetical protein EPN82_03235 [Bacteroidota bacterium]
MAYDNSQTFVNFIFAKCYNGTQFSLIFLLAMPQVIYNESFEQFLNLADSENLINYTIENNNPNMANLIVPTGKLVNHHNLKAVRKYYERYNKPVTNFNIFTLKSFITSIFWKITDNNDYKLISDAYRFALFEEASEKAKLKFYKQTAQPLSPVILQKLSDLIYGLKEDGITVEQLSEDLASSEENQTEIEPKKLSDIISLYETYQELLGSKYLDFAELLSGTNKIIEQKVNVLNQLFSEKSLILIDGFSEFRQPELKFISHFAESTVPLAIVIDYSTELGPLGVTLENTILALTGKGFKLVSTEKNEEDKISQQQNRKYFLSRWLFTSETKVKGPDFGDIIKVYAADSRLEEVVSISKLVKFLIQKNNYKPGEICICIRTPDNYSELYREIFSLYNIPVNISDRYPLDRSPVAIAVFSVLDIITRGFRRDDIHRTILSPYLSYLRKTEGDEKSIDGDNLFSIALKLRITGGLRRGGAEFWKTRLTSYRDAINNKIALLKKSDTPDQMEIEMNLADLSNIIKAFSDFKQLQKLLPDGKARYSPTEFLEIIKENILSNFNVKGNILKLYEFIKSSADLSSIERNNLLEEVERDGRAFSTIINLLDEFAFIYEERYPKKKFTLDELAGRFKTMVSSAKYQIREKHNYGVTVTSIEQTRGISYKVMFLCGALDGEFPLKYQTEVFLGKELPDSEDKHILSERMQFFQFLTNSTENLNSGIKKIFITYPKYNEGEQLVKSPFVDSLLNIIAEDKNEFEFDLARIRKDINEGNTEVNDFEWLYSIANESELLEYLTKKGQTKIPDEYLLNKQSLSKSIEYINFCRKNKKGEIDLTSRLETVQNDSEVQQKIFSVSDLETYASCPFKYFVKKQIKPLEEKVEDFTLEAFEKGSIYHNILYRFYSTLQEETIKSGNSEIMILPKSEGFPVIASVYLEKESESGYLKLLKEIAEDELKKIQFVHPFFELEAEEITGSKSKPGILENWLKSEIQRIDSGWQFLPCLFEFGFGLSLHHGKSSAIPPVKICDDFYMRGKIDRIEIGFNNNKPLLLVTDYKSKSTYIKSYTENVIETSFQMPLYMLAAKSILEHYYDIHPELAGALYYILNPIYDKDKLKKELFFLQNTDIIPMQSKSSARYYVSSEKMSEILDDSVEKCNSIIESINRREFPVKPVSGACRNCTYQSVCRIDEKGWAGNSEDTFTPEE